MVWSLTLKKVDRGCTFFLSYYLFLEGGGGGLLQNIGGDPQFYCDFWKSSLGSILIVQLCIFSCKDNAIVGYNVLCCI